MGASTDFGNELTATQKDFIRLSAEVEHLSKLLDDMRHAMVEMRGVMDQQSAKLSKIQLDMASAKGGWRALMWAGGAAASIAGFIGWAISHYKP